MIRNKIAVRFIIAARDWSKSIFCWIFYENFYLLCVPPKNQMLWIIASSFCLCTCYWLWFDRNCYHFYFTPEASRISASSVLFVRFRRKKISFEKLFEINYENGNSCNKYLWYGRICRHTSFKYLFLYKYCTSR